MSFLERVEEDMFNNLEKEMEARNDGLALKLFQDFCCDGCSCKSEKDHETK
jgi:hypothetical protein